jgi:hypothetical protein
MNPLAPDRELETPYRTARRLRHAALGAYFAGVVGAPLKKCTGIPSVAACFQTVGRARRGRLLHGQLQLHLFPLHSGFPFPRSGTLADLGHAVTRPEWAGLNGLASGCGLLGAGYLLLR